MKKSAFICIILAGVLWGTSALFSYWLTPLGFNALHVTAVRGTVALVVMLGFVLIKDPRLLKFRLKELPLLIGSGAGLFFTSYTYFASMAASSVSTAVILMYTAPILVMLYSVLFLGERFTALKGVSVALMSVGCALVSGVVGGLSFSLEGVLFGIAAGISYSAYNVFTKILTMHRVEPLTVTTYNFLTVAILGLALGEPAQIITAAVNEPISILAMLGVGVCTSVLPYVFYTVGLRDTPAGVASALAVVEPLSATALSVVFLGERLTLPSMLGGVLILGAVVLLSRIKNEKDVDK